MKVHSAFLFRKVAVIAIAPGLLIIILEEEMNNFINESAILELNQRVAQLPHFQ